MKSIIAATNKRVPANFRFLFKFKPSKIVPPKAMTLTIPINAPSVEKKPKNYYSV